MNTKKKEVIILEEKEDLIKLKFPKINIPISVSKNYFEKISNSQEYILKKN